MCACACALELCHSPDMRLCLRMASLIRSYVTSSVQLTSAFLVMLGRVPRENAKSVTGDRNAYMDSAIHLLEQPGTFPEPTDALVLVDVFVGLHGAIVATGHAVQVHLGLEPNLDHVCGLCKRHGHGACGAACQDADQHAGVCRREGRKGGTEPGASAKQHQLSAFFWKEFMIY